MLLVHYSIGVHVHVYAPYRINVAEKFGSLAICLSTAKLKSTKMVFRMHVCMAIPYHIIKFNPPIVLKTSLRAKPPIYGRQKSGT